MNTTHSLSSPRSRRTRRTAFAALALGAMLALTGCGASGNAPLQNTEATEAQLLAQQQPQTGCVLVAGPKTIEYSGPQTLRIVPGASGGEAVTLQRPGQTVMLDGTSWVALDALTPCSHVKLTASSAGSLALSCPSGCAQLVSSWQLSAGQRSTALTDAAQVLANNIPAAKGFPAGVAFLLVLTCIATIVIAIALVSLAYTHNRSN